MTGKAINIVENGVSAYVVYMNDSVIKSMVSIDLIREVQTFDNNISNEFCISLKGTDNSGSVLAFNNENDRDSAANTISSAILTKQRPAGRVVHTFKKSAT